MKLKGKLIEFMIVHDLVPMRIRWGKSASGIGRMFNDVFHIVETLKIERNLHGCAIALMGMHRVFGIKSHIVEENANEVKIHATECMWKNKKEWTPEVCASIDGYERGLSEGIDKNILHICTKRRSDGDNFCELVLRNRDHFISKS